jgi:hypothetical protein
VQPKGNLEQGFAVIPTVLLGRREEEVQKMRFRKLLRSGRRESEADRIIEKTRFLKKMLHSHESKNTQIGKIDTESRRML